VIGLHSLPPASRHAFLPRHICKYCWLTGVVWPRGAAPHVLSLARILLPQGAPILARSPSGETSDDDTGDFGHTISISGDGHTMAIGYPADYGTGYGPRAAPLIAGSKSTGGVYVYRLTDSWKLANVVKPNYVASGGAHEFGAVTALSGTGKTLVVGVPDESSWAVGIGGDWANAGRAGAGALFMY
jgi:hypothetical protein